MQVSCPWRLTLPVSFTLVGLLFGLPLLAAQPAEAMQSLHGPVPPTVQTISSETPQAVSTDPEPLPETAPIVLQVLHHGGVVPMDLEDYLVGVVRAEMPASFEPEALKAQAVAARTYTLYQIAGGGRHGEAQICTNPGCCQAYIEEADIRARWGSAADDLCAKTAAAVRETAGEILTYEDEPILAVFHAASPALTRAAGDVWNRDLPYLQSVSSPEGGASVPGYHDTRSFTPEDFKSRLAGLGCDFDRPISDWLRNPVTDAAGSVETLEVGGIPLSGTRFRQLLGLRSVCFTWSITENQISFTTTGYGHGVGMSQYGANALAAEGKTYREILAHYYPGTTPGPASGAVCS